MNGIVARLRAHAQQLLDFAERVERKQAQFEKRTRALMSEARRRTAAGEQAVRDLALQTRCTGVRDARIAAVVTAVAETRGFPVSELVAPGKAAEVVECRYFAMHALRVLLGLGSTKVSNVFRRNHACAVNAERYVANLRAIDPKFAARLESTMAAAKSALRKVEEAA